MASAKSIFIEGKEYIIIKGKKGSLRLDVRESEEVLADLQIMYTRAVFDKPRATTEAEIAKEMYLYGGVDNDKN